MVLPEHVKHRLVERFEPILYMHIDEPDYPVSPVEYVERAALWTSSPPDHPRSGWGVPAGSDRLPLIERGAISLDPAHDVHGTADPDGDGINEFYLGQSDEGRFPFLRDPYRELWFDVGGWQDGPAVTPASVNRRTDPGPRPPLEQPWYSADVWTVDEYRDVVGYERLIAHFGIGPEDRPEVLESLVVVSFHFLFPLHRQQRRRTALQPEDDRWTNDYEGDWSTFAVIAGFDHGLPPEQSAETAVPLFGGFGQRWRGISPDHDDRAAGRMQLRPWSTLVAVDGHAAVVAAPGTHNLHPPDAMSTPTGTIKPTWTDTGLGASEPANAFVRDSTEEPYAAVFSLKIIGGLALLGPLGIVVGAVAAAAEASSAEEEGLYEPPKLSASPPPEQDDPLVDDAYDLEKDKIGTTAAVPNPPLADLSQSEVRQWESAPEESLVDGSLLLSPYGNADRPTFTGRWGVRCDDDGFLFRSGIRLSDYRSQIVQALLTHR